MGKTTLLLFCLSIFSIGFSQNEYRFCVPQGHRENCDKMVQEVKNGKFKCVIANDKVGCMRKIVEDEADLTVLEPEEIFVAGRYAEERLVILAEVRALDNIEEVFRYEPVALIKKSSGINSVPELQGKKSCHTGFGRNAGWKIPFSNLLELGGLDKYCSTEGTTIERDMAAIAKYFSKACVPGPYSNDFSLNQALKEKYPNMCSLCKHTCDRNDAFAGYEGAIKCVTTGEGDVAWTKADAVFKYFNINIEAGKSDTKNSPELYNYLCRNGSMMELTTKEPCSWAGRPWRAFIGTKRLKSAQIKEVQSEISLYRKTGAEESPPPEWLESVLEFSTNDTVHHHSSAQLSKPYSPFIYLSKGNYIKTIENPSCPSNKTVKFCVRSELEMNKCRDLSLASEGRRIVPKIGCVLGKDVQNCLQLIVKGDADIISVSAQVAHNAMKDYPTLKPVLSEEKNLGQETNSFIYSVAVIRANENIHNVSDLKGKKSCHGGVREIFGWHVPLNGLKSLKFTATEDKNLNSDCPFGAGFFNFFGGSCIPGSKTPGIWGPNQTEFSNKFCQICIGSGDESGDSKDTICADHDVEKFHGPSGAFMCLASGKGDVAFMDHVTALEESRNDPGNYKLACLNGGIKDVNEFSTCNWGKVSSHKILARVKSESEPIWRDEIRQTLIKVASSFAPSSLAELIFKLFGPYYGNKDLIFEDNTIALKYDEGESEVTKFTNKILDNFDSCTAAGSKSQFFIFSLIITFFITYL